MPVALPPGRAKLATIPSLTGSSPTPKTIGIVAVAALAASVGTLPRGDHSHLSAYEIGCQGRQPIGLIESAQPELTATFSPSTYPVSFRPR